MKIAQSHRLSPRSAGLWPNEGLVYSIWRDVRRDREAGQGRTSDARARDVDRELGPTTVIGKAASIERWYGGV